jgi:SAM-dependent methyltransferase
VKFDTTEVRTEQSGALDWIRETIRVYGLFGAVAYYFGRSIEFLRDLTPQRRRSRYGDIDYDFDHSVDTTWANIPLRTRLRELLSGGQYQASEPALFHEIMQALPVRRDGFTFIDLGSGKGRTLLMASDYSFRRIIGVELLEELNEIARRNVARYNNERQKCFAIESLSGDARGFDFPGEPSVLYLFNPFPKHVLQEVLENLQRSLAASPREVFVIYHNMIYERVFVDCDWLRPVLRTTQYAIYEARPE